MALFDKITDAAKTAGDRASDAIELTKLKNKISNEKKEVDIEYAKIGKIYYDKAKAGDYLNWFARTGFPKGEIGRLLALMHEIDHNGLSDLLKP